jgi:CSLREA domain-containing protein
MQVHIGRGFWPLIYSPALNAPNSRRHNLSAPRLTVSALAFLAIVTLIGLSPLGRERPADAEFTIKPPPPFFAVQVVVNTTVDESTAPNGQCSLREAIMTVNSGTDTGGCTYSRSQLGDFVIKFNVGGPNPTIATNSVLPAITKRVLIDGNTGGATRVVLNGTNTPSPIDGLVFSGNSGGSAVHALVLQNFLGAIRVGVPDVSITGNYIGTSADGTTSSFTNNEFGIHAFGSGNGVLIGGTNGVTPSGPCTGDCNLISGSSEYGVVFTTSNVSIRGNFIGTNAAGTAALGNQVGIYDAGSGAVIGGSAPGAGNLISGNSDYGIRDFSDSSPSISGNKIGTNAAESAAIANDYGVVLDIDGADLGVVGGAPNVISGNTQSGVSVFANANTIVNNLIGTTEDGAAIGNGEFGINVGEQLLTDIGLGASGGNTIAFNGSSGVIVGMSASSISIRGNSIFSNEFKGIEIIAGGNNSLHPPEITSAAANSVTGTATLPSPKRPCPNCTIEVFSDNEDEGRIYEGFTTTNASGNWTFNGPLHGPNITATTSNVGGDTSEFSLPFTLPATPTPSASPTATPSPTPSFTPTPTPTRSPTPTPTFTATVAPATTTPQNPTQGDVDCDGDVDLDDADGLLEFAAGIFDGEQSGCLDFGDTEANSGFPWGDVNCDGFVNAIDALFIVAFKEGIALPQAAGNCFPLGQTMT